MQKEAGIRTLAVIPFGIPDLVRPVGVIHRRQKPLTPAASRFVELLQDPGAHPALAPPPRSRAQG